MNNLFSNFPIVDRLIVQKGNFGQTNSSEFRLNLSNVTKQISKTDTSLGKKVNTVVLRF